MKYKQKKLKINDNFYFKLTTWQLPKTKRVMNLEFHPSQSIEIPNLYFVLLSIYNKKTKKHIYGGRPCDALHVYCSDNPIDLDNINYEDFYFFAGWGQYSVCTNHKYDYKNFASTGKMIEFITNEFLSLRTNKKVKTQIKAGLHIKERITKNGFSSNYTEHKNYFFLSDKPEKLKQNWDEKQFPYFNSYTLYIKNHENN